MTDHSPMTDPHADIEIRLLSQPRYLCVARAAIGAAAERLGFDEQQTSLVMLAVDEAVTNIIRHGYDGRPDGPIWIKLSPIESNGRGGVRIVIEDRARQVDPAAIAGRPLEDVRPGGLGVHVIRQVMDEVCYHPRDDGGMRLTMTKWLEHAPETTPTQEARSS